MNTSCIALKRHNFCIEDILRFDIDGLLDGETLFFLFNSSVSASKFECHVTTISQYVLKTTDNHFGQSRSAKPYARKWHLNAHDNWR